MASKSDALIAEETAARAAALEDEAALFASPLPTTGERKTTTRKELWASSRPQAYPSRGTSTTWATLV